MREYTFKFIFLWKMSEMSKGLMDVAMYSVIILTGLTCLGCRSSHRVIFLGDSITETGDQQGGYISLMREKLNKDEYELIGAGIAGNTISDLLYRYEKDVISRKPDMVFIYIGINDVWHKQVFGKGTDPDMFKKHYTDMARRIRNTGARVILCTPSVIGEKKNGENFLDRDLDLFAGLIREVAAETGSEVCDLRKIFTVSLLGGNPDNKSQDILTNDGVHLNDAGNRLVAEVMLTFFKKEQSPEERKIF